MPSPASKNVIARFGPFEADLSTEELRKFGTRVRLANQSFQVLALLLDRPGQLVSREELRQKLWPSDTFVEYDQGLNAAVNRLRDALGDSADKPRYVETLPRRGYRFIAEVVFVPEETTAAPSGSSASDPAAAPVAIVEPPAGVAPEPDKGRSTWGFLLPSGSRIIIIVLCILILAAAVVMLRKSRTEYSFSSVKVAPFTSLLGQEISPAFSPDGSQVVFAWSSSLGQGFDLYVKTIGSERTIKLTDHPARWITPAWSPDGTQIAFARWAEDGSGIFMVPALGGAERKLVYANFWYEPFMQISWSPDSRSLAYWSTDDQGSHVFLLSLDTLQPQTVQPDRHCWDMASPSFSPDGKNLAFVCTSSIAVYGIYESPVAGGSSHQLVSMMGYFGGLTWSADGKQVIFSNDSGDGGSLWEVDLEGRLRKLPFGEEGSNPSMAPRGNRLAYVRGSKTVNIWRLDLSSPDPEKSATKLVYSTRIQRVPQYSPGGKKIVFESDRSGAHEIWLADADGSNLVQLTSFNGPQTGSPSWCSDGRRIAFDSRASGSSAIYVEDIDSRLPQEVKTDVPNLALPAWSDDCQWLIASDGHDNIYRLSSQGGPATRVSDKGSWFSTVRNGRVFFNVKQDKDVAIWSRPIEGDREEPLPGMPALDAAESWTATTRGIYYTSSRSNATAIDFYDFGTRTVRHLCTLPQSPTSGGGLSVSPDGRWLLYTQTDDAQSDIMLANHLE